MLNVLIHKETTLLFLNSNLEQFEEMTQVVLLRELERKKLSRALGKKKIENRILLAYRDKCFRLEIMNI